jgi:hypothetical protein
MYLRFVRLYYSAAPPVYSSGLPQRYPLSNPFFLLPHQNLRSIIRRIMKPTSNLRKGTHMLFVEFIIRLMNHQLETGQGTRTKNGPVFKAITPSQSSVDTINYYHVGYQRVRRAPRDSNQFSNNSIISFRAHPVRFWGKSPEVFIVVNILPSELLALVREQLKFINKYTTQKIFFYYIIVF